MKHKPVSKILTGLAAALILLMRVSLVTRGSLTVPPRSVLVGQGKEFILMVIMIGSRWTLPQMKRLF